jgi:hypothetical protein
MSMSDSSLQNHVLFLKAASTTVEYLQELGMEFELLDDNEKEWLIVGSIETEIGQVRLMLALRAQPCQLVVYAYHPLIIVSSMRTIAIELFARINHELAIGNFEIDLDDGHIRFRNGIDFSGAILPKAYIKTAVELAFGTLATYHTPLVRTLFDDCPPKDALDDI